MKYIDADLLRKEIEFAKSVYSNPKRVVAGVADAFRQDGRAAMCDDILKEIDSLQQEQPELPNKEIAEYYYHKGVYEGPSQGRADALKLLDEVAKSKADPTIIIKQQEQPSEDLEEEIKRYYTAHFDYITGDHPTLYILANIALHFAEWQKEQMLKDAVEREVKEDAGGYPYIDATELYDYTEDKPLARKGDKVLVIREVSL